MGVTKEADTTAHTRAHTHTLIHFKRGRIPYLLKLAIFCMPKRTMGKKGKGKTL